MPAPRSHARPPRSRPLAPGPPANPHGRPGADLCRARDVSTQAKWFPVRRFSEEIGIRIDTSVTSWCRAMRFGDAAMLSDEVGSCEMDASLRWATNRQRAALFPCREDLIERGSSLRH